MPQPIAQQPGSVPQARRLTVAWGGLQRRLRRLVPRSIRRADLALFRGVAATELPLVGPLLPVLSRAANNSRLWFAIAGVLAAAGGRFGRRAAVRGALAIGVTSAVTNLPAKLITGRERPDLSTVPRIRQLARVPVSTSFPSGHSASAFAFATAASMEDPRLRPPLYGLAAAVALSRVYTGVHYPGDVLVGSAMGVAVARATTRSWPLADPTPATAQDVEDPGGEWSDDGTGIALIVNRGAGRDGVPEPAKEFRRRLPGVRLLEAEPDEDLVATMRRGASEAGVLAVAGGDGTASTAAEVASEQDVSLALVPAGTLNHLAKDLGLESVDAAVDAVRQRCGIRIDLGEVDGRAFVNAASLGAYPELVAARERLEDHIGKWPAALWSMLRVLTRGEPMEVELDGHRRRVWLLFIGNGQFSTEGVAPARRRRLDDGLLDIRLVHAEKPWARTRALVATLAGRLEQSDVYQRRTARQLHVRAAAPLRLAADGETWTSSAEEVTVTKRPAALTVLQPRRPPPH